MTQTLALYGLASQPPTIYTGSRSETEKRFISCHFIWLALKAISRNPICFFLVGGFCLLSSCLFFSWFCFYFFACFLSFLLFPASVFVLLIVFLPYFIFQSCRRRFDLLFAKCHALYHALTLRLFKSVQSTYIESTQPCTTKFLIKP